MRRRELSLNIKYKYSRNVAIVGVAMLLLGGVAFLQPFDSDNSYAADHQDNAEGAYNGTTYSLTTTVSDLNLELKNVTPAGKAVYGKQTVNVVTTAPGGYQLYMQTSGNLAGTLNGSATSDSIAALPTNNSALDTNSWGYVTASALSSASTTLDEDMNKAATQTVWNTPPSTLTQIDATSSSATSGRDTDIYYGIKADNTLTGDNYSGTITYTTIANDAASDTLLSVSPTSGTAGQATTLTIITSLMTTTDGLSASDISATVGGYTCGSISISSRAPLTFTCNTSTDLKTAGAQTVTVTINKYNKTYTKTSAYTVKVGDLSNKPYMHQATTSMCANSKTFSTSNVSGTTYEVVDARTNEKYWVRKFGNLCWMVENLYLPAGTTISTANNYSKVNFSTYPTTSSTGTWLDEANGAKIANGSRYRASNSGYNDGTYMNWYTATAGTGGDRGTDKAATSDICPTNWRLPTNSEQETIKTTINNLGINNFYATSTGATTSPIRPGHYYSSGLYGAGTNAYWWSSTQASATRAYYLYSNSSSLGASNNDKYYGCSVRCVLPSS